MNSTNLGVSSFLLVYNFSVDSCFFSSLFSAHFVFIAFDQHFSNYTTIKKASFFFQTMASSMLLTDVEN